MYHLRIFNVRRKHELKRAPRRSFQCGCSNPALSYLSECERKLTLCLSLEITTMIALFRF